MKLRRQKRINKMPRHCKECDRPVTDFRHLITHEKCGAGVFLVLDPSKFVAGDTIIMKTNKHPTAGDQFYWPCCDPNPNALTISGHEPGTVVGMDGKALTHH